MKKTEMYIMALANETAMMFADEERQLADKALFVQNLGVLLSQTREGINACILYDEDTVEVEYMYPDGSFQRDKINIAHDSYAAIIRDVMRAL